MSETRQRDAVPVPFGEHLRRFRVAAGLSQEALAERAGLSVQAVGALETGKRRRPYPHTVAVLADALELSIEDRGVLTNARVTSALAVETTLPLLPPPPVPLIGREEELRVIRSRLAAGRERVLTVTGPGGVGKTSLALAVAAEADELFSRDVAFVPLADITDASLIAAEVAPAVGVPTTGQESLDAVVRRALLGRRMLLVLDNLEHLPTAALWIAELLAACPALTILATSRAPLRIRGEREIPLGPLALPDFQAIRSPAEVQDVPAVRLFIERAPGPAFALTQANAAAVTAICRRVDGLPLAIELAAARVKVLSPAALLARLDQMLPVLTGGPQDQSHRLRSMEAAIAWSYDLLDPAERTLFRRLSVFAGGFTLEAAETVGQGDLASSASTLDLVASLVDKSLLRRLDAGDGEPRFGMLATIQAYGLQQLAATGESDEAHQAHAAYAVELAERTWPDFRQQAGVDLLDAERANLRAALNWLHEHGDEPHLLRLAGALSWYWYIHGPLDEGRVWMERALATDAAQQPGPARAKALIGAALLAHYQGADDLARDWLNAGLEQAEAMQDPWLHGASLMLLGIIAEDQGRYQEAEDRFTAALAIFQANNARSDMALALNHLGVVAWGLGDVDRAAVRCQESLALQRELGENWGLSVALGYLGLLAAEQGNVAQAAALHGESLRLRWDASIWEEVIGSLVDLASLAAMTGRPRDAARLFGSAEALREASGRLLTANYPERVVYERERTRALAALGAEDFAAAEAEGRTLPRDRAISEALDLAEEIARGGHLPTG